MRYLLDSDTLIAAKNLHYRPGFCNNFWTWIEDGHTAQKIFSIDIVQKELLAGDPNDYLHVWAQNINHQQPSFFKSTKGCLNEWPKLTTWAHSKGFKQGAITKFLTPSAADAWLIAYALQNLGKYTIVTNEISSPTRISSIQLPDAASAFNVPVIGLYDLLSIHSTNNFSFV